MPTFRDESDRDGMRIVIELKRDAYPRVVLNNLYRADAPAETTFGVNMLSLVKWGTPAAGLKPMLEVFLDFRIETITRRTRYELRKAEERDHILQGYLIAWPIWMPLLPLIRGAADTPTASRS